MEISALNSKPTLKVTNRILFTFLMIFLISGCVTTSELVKPSDSASVVEYTKQLQTSTSAGLDFAMVAIDRDLKNNGDHVIFKTWWCPRHKDVYGINAVINEYGKYCNEKGGSYNAPFCVNANNSDDVLFYANIVNSRKCGGKYETADVTVIEPTGNRDSQRYMLSLKRVGFRTSEDRRYQRSNAAMQQAREAIRQKRDAAKMQNIGTKICKDERRFTYIGYVERVEAVKIQIRVAHAHMKGNPSIRPGGFSPSIIWDNPTNWYVCE